MAEPAAVPLVLLASARKESDTRRLVQNVFQDRPHRKVDLLDYVISPYRYENDYPEEDEFLQVMELVQQHSVIVLATPVYWYAMSGMLKTFFDRLTDLVSVHKPLGRQLKNKTCFLVAVGADPKLPDGFEEPFKLTANYLQMNYGGHIYLSTAELGSAEAKQKEIAAFLSDVEK